MILGKIEVSVVVVSGLILVVLFKEETHVFLPRPVVTEAEKSITKASFVQTRGFIVTTWRSGSTFLSEVLNSHPNAFYFSEPLNYLGITRVRSGSDPRSNDAVEVFRTLFKCEHNFTADQHSPWPSKFQFEGNFRMREVCGYDRWKEEDLCLDIEFLDEQCQMYPILLAKSVRLALSLTESLINDDQLANLKVLYLVRDPRGTINSRKERDFCVKTRSCIDPGFLCTDLVYDYFAYLELKEKYPQKISFLRYEDLLENMHDNLARVAHFFDMKVHNEMWKYVEEHTKLIHAKEQQPWNTFRDVDKLKDHWKTQLSMDAVKEIQAKCKKAMRLWGYKEIQDEFQLENLTVPISSLHELDI